MLWEPGQQVLRTDRNWLGKDGKTSPVPADGHIKLDRQRWKDKSNPSRWPHQARKAEWLCTKGKESHRTITGKAQNQWPRSPGTVVLGPSVVPQVKGYLHGSDGKGVTGPRKDFGQRLEFGASGLPDGESEREEVHEAPFRGPWMPGLGTGLDSPVGREGTVFLAGEWYDQFEKTDISFHFILFT